MPACVATSDRVRARVRVRVRLTLHLHLTLTPTGAADPSLCTPLDLQGATLKLGTVVGPALGGLVAYFCGGASPFFFSAAVHVLTLCMLWAWLPSDPGSTCRPARFTRVSQGRTGHVAREDSPRLLAPPRRARDKAARFASPACSDRPAVGRPGTPRAEAEAGALLDGVRRMLRTAPVVIAVSFAGSARSFLLPLKAAG